MISEVRELLSKGAVIETSPSPGSFVSQIFLEEKKGGGTETGHKPEGSQCETRAFQNGGSPHSPRPHPTRGLDDKTGPEGCLSSGTNSHRSSTSPPVPKTYQFQCLPFGLTSTLWVFSKIMKPVVGALQHMDICLVIYLDNLLVLHQSKEELTQLTPLICQLFGLWVWWSIEGNPD